MNTTLNKPIKAAVVGGGAFGEVHLRTFASMPQVQIAGIYTLETARGEELCRRYGGRNYASLEELATDPEIDLVSIATPEAHHLKPFQILAKNGKAIYIEKPLSTSLKEAKEILVLSKSIIAMSGHCLRFEQRLAYVFERLRGVQKYHLSFRDRRTRLEKETYGRVHPACSMLCHEIELSNAFAESTFKRVMAMETHYSEGQVDGMNILIEYQNDVTSSVEGGWYLPAQNSCIENDLISIVSANGIDELAMPHLGYYQLDNDGMKIPNLYYGNTVYGVEYGPVRAAFDYIVNCFIENKQPQISTIQDGYNAVELIEAAMMSVREKRWATNDEITKVLL